MHGFLEKELPDDSGRPLSRTIFTYENKMAAAKKQCLVSVFCIKLSLHLPSFLNEGK